MNRRTFIMNPITVIVMLSLLTSANYASDDVELSMSILDEFRDRQMIELEKYRTALTHVYEDGLDDLESLRQKCSSDLQKLEIQRLRQELSEYEEKFKCQLSWNGHLVREISRLEADRERQETQIEQLRSVLQDWIDQEKQNENERVSTASQTVTKL